MDNLFLAKAQKRYELPLKGGYIGVKLDDYQQAAAHWPVGLAYVHPHLLMRSLNKQQ